MLKKYRHSKEVGKRWVQRKIWLCEAEPWVLCSVFGRVLQKGHWRSAACPKMGCKAGEGSENILWGVLEEAGVVILEKRKPRERTSFFSTSSCEEVSVRWGLVSSATSRVKGWEEMAWRFTRGNSDLTLEIIFTVRVLDIEISCPGMWWSVEVFKGPLDVALGDMVRGYYGGAKLTVQLYLEDSPRLWPWKQNWKSKNCHIFFFFAFTE